MPKVVGVRFRTSPRMYWFEPTGEDEAYKKGAVVVVETQRGVEIATVIMPPTEVEESKIVQPLKPVLRIATETDLESVRQSAEQKQSILATAKQKVEERKLDMKIVDCEFTVDHSKLVLYFTAEQRVDFRELVRDLAQAFHIRIDLRQISGRDECKLIGSLGPCGMPCCCGGFESDSEHVSIKMAKNQNLALTPGKINGMCGRLLCCLAYENKTYEDVIKKAPKHGAWVTCPDGRRGTVVSVAPLTEKVRVRVGDDDNFEFCEFLLSELDYEKKSDDARPNAGGDGSGEKKNGGNNNNRRNDRRRDGNNARGDGEKGERKKRFGGKNDGADKNGDNVNKGNGSVENNDNKNGDNNGGSRNRNRRKKNRGDRHNNVRGGATDNNGGGENA